MKRTVLKYGVALAAGALLLQWLEQQYAIRLYSTEIYIVLLALLFTGLGIWFGARIRPHRPDDKFERNDKAIEALELTDREMEVLAPAAATLLFTFLEVFPVALLISLVGAALLRTRKSQRARPASQCSTRMAIPFLLISMSDGATREYRPDSGAAAAFPYFPDPDGQQRY